MNWELILSIATCEIRRGKVSRRMARWISILDEIFVLCCVAYFPFVFFLGDEAEAYFLVSPMQKQHLFKRYTAIMEKKLTMTFEELCEGMPQEPLLIFQLSSCS